MKIVCTRDLRSEVTIRIFRDQPYCDVAHAASDEKDCVDDRWKHCTEPKSAMLYHEGALSIIHRDSPRSTSAGHGFVAASRSTQELLRQILESKRVKAEAKRKAKSMDQDAKEWEFVDEDEGAEWEIVEADDYVAECRLQ